MKIYTNQNVEEAALERIELLFNEFETICVSFSGGKDSVVILDLCLRVARKLNRLPLKVMFIDQEAEWNATIELVKGVMYNPEVEPLWYQMPLRLFNATSTEENWLQCWEVGKEHIHPQDPIAITENVYGSDRFVELFTQIAKKDFKKNFAMTTGVRAEESPTRTMGLTSFATYKWITWGVRIDKPNRGFTFHPIYDWSYTDVWKYIFVHKCSYNKIYDFMYMHGVPINKMRVSNVHHETAVQSLFILQEFEPETYDKIVNRIAGISTATHLGVADTFVKELPYMFKDWVDYRDYLLENIITKEEQRVLYRQKFIELDKRYSEMADMKYLYIAQINTLLVNDYHFTKLKNWEFAPDAAAYRNYHKGRGILKNHRYIKH